MTEASSTGDGTPRHEQNDDLTTIKLIGPKTQDWLRQSFNVHTFKDLAALSVDEIHARLQLDGKTVARAVIGEWIAQAAKAVEAAASADRPAEPARQLQNTASERETSAASGGWQPFASFVVEFQAHGQSGERRTLAHHIEEDRDETWPGIEGEKLGRWMVHSIGDERQQEGELPQPEKEAPIDAALTVFSPTIVEIVGIWMVQPPQAGTPLYTRGEAHPSFVRGGQPFALEASFELTGPGAADTAASGAQYRAQFYAHNLSTAGNTHLGDTAHDVTSADRLSYSALLPDATLAPGVYRLDCIAILEGATVRPGHCRIPLFQVV